MRLLKVFAVIVVLAVSSQTFGQNTTPGWSDAQINYDPSTGYLTWVNNYPTTSTPVLEGFIVNLAGPTSEINGGVAGAPAVPNGSGYLAFDSQWNGSYGVLPDTGGGSEIDISNLSFGSQQSLPEGTYLVGVLPKGLGSGDFGNASDGTSDNYEPVAISDTAADWDYRNVNVVQSVPEPGTLALLAAGLIVTLGAGLHHRLGRALYDRCRSPASED